MSQNRQPGVLAPLVNIGLASPLAGLAQDFASGELIRPHRHDVAQLIHASRGVLTVETDDGVWVIPPARGVWVPAGLTHSIAMSGAVELRTLYVSSSAVPVKGAECCVVHVQPLLQQAILRVIGFDQAYAADSPESRLVAVVLDEIRAARIAPLHLPMPVEPRARAVADRFLSDTSMRRTTREWARDAGASERTFERLYLREVGVSFGKWQQQARLLEALRLLANGCNVTTAALQVGFATPSAFIAMFRRTMGTTPGRYFHEPDA